MGFSLPRLRAQIVKEFLCVFRDPRARIVIIAPPMMQLMIFSFAATLEVRHTSVAVFDQDGGRAAVELTTRLAHASFVGTVHPVHSEAELRGMLDRREILLGLTIPPDFSRKLVARHPAPLQVLVDGRRANSGQVALGYVQAVAADLGVPLHHTAAAVPSPTAVRHWFNPNLNYKWFVVPSLAGILAMFTSLIITSLSIAREREMGTFDQLLVSPTTPMEIIVAKTVPALIIGTGLGMAMVAAGSQLFSVPLQGSLVLLVLTMMLFILSVVGVGLMISAVCQTQQQAILGTFGVGVPMILMSGFATPVENMPPFLQMVAELLPLRHELVIVQGTFLKALPPEDVAAHAWPMAVISLVTLTVAARWVRNRLQ